VFKPRFRNIPNIMENKCCHASFSQKRREPSATERRKFV